jgi:hypothetical protein
MGLFTPIKHGDASRLGFRPVSQIKRRESVRVNKHLILTRREEVS